MNAHVPGEAQRIVVEYVRMLEDDILRHRHPGRLDALPFAKSTIRTAIRTSVQYLAESRQLTEELRAYFETAYTSLADYVEAEVADLLAEYARAAESLTAGPSRPDDKTRSQAWRTVADAGVLAGAIARAIAAEAEQLRAEFHDLIPA